MLVKCKVCGKEFQCTPSRLKPNGNCCSKECQKIDFKSKDLNVTCDYCGKKYHLRHYYLNSSEHHFCSNDCKYKAMKTIMSGENNSQYGLKGKLNSSWKSDEKITNYGYKKIRCLNHPFKDSDGFVFEHRLIAEKYLLNEENSIEINGTLYLKPEYQVHHINENKLDNRVENLKVLTASEHKRLHNLMNPHQKRDNSGRFK